MARHHHDITTLNALISSTIDSAEGYAEAAREAQGGRYAALFSQRAGERRAMVTTLQREVNLLGGEAERRGSVLAGAGRLFFNLKSAITNHDEAMIVKEVEGGEAHIRAKYEDAVLDRELSPPVRAILEQTYRRVLEGHDEMRDIKHGLQG